MASSNNRSSRHVRITYSHPGTQPPVYVATSLSSPPWQPLEMRCGDQRTNDGELIFHRDFENVDAGSYQYKFRLGPGDWWVLDETAATGENGDPTRKPCLLD